MFTFFVVIGADRPIEVAQHGLHRGRGAVGHAEWLIFANRKSLLIKGGRHGAVPAHVATVGGLRGGLAHLGARAGVGHADVAVLTERVLRLHN